MQTQLKPLIYITEPEEVDPKAINRLKRKFRIVTGDPHVKKNHDPRISGLILRSKTIIDQTILNSLPNLKFIIRVGVGLENIDQTAAHRKGIRIFNAPGSNAHSVAEFIIGMMLTALRHWNELAKKTDNRFIYLGRELRGRSIGIIGYGHIGQLVVQKLAQWECKEFLIYDPFIEIEQSVSLIQVSSLDDVLKQAEIISLQLPLNDQTVNLLSKEKLSLLQNNTILINASRGQIVDEVSIEQIMVEKNGIYVSDVTTLDSSKHIIATPHIAALTKEANEAMAMEAIENFLSRKEMHAPY